MKNIFKFCAFLAFFCILSCRKDAPGIDVKEGMNVVGYVRDDSGAPVSGAVVSDGHTCVATDADGIYQMKVPSGTRKVFVSVPSGYDIPMSSSGLPKIYNSFVLMKDKPVQSDFTLSTSGGVEDFTLFVLADVQLEHDNACAEFEDRIMPEILRYTSTLQGPVIGLSLGDMVWDQMDYMAGSYAGQIVKLGFPVFHVIGNHDYDVRALTLEDADNVFENTFGPVNWSFNYGQCHFIGINNITYTPQDKANYKREVSESTLEWLRQDLSYVPKDRLVILSMHAPSQRRDQPYSTSYLTNCEKLYDALDGYKVVIMSGHLHHNYTYTVSGSIVEHNHASLMGNDWDNNAQGLCNDGSPRGFTIYSISGNRLTDNYYKGALTDRDYQMEIYAPGEYDSQAGKGNFSSIRKNDMVVNIFNWHTDWTVKVDEDGEVTELSEDNIKAQDLNAYKLNFSFATDHIFRYAPKSENWKKITVTAKDPYGNEYTDYISH